MTLKINRAPLLSTIKLYASFHHHMWIQAGVTVRKRLSWVMTSVTLTFDLWPWPFAWISLLSLVITPDNFVAIRWQEQSEKGVTDRQADGRTDRKRFLRAAWPQLKNHKKLAIALMVQQLMLTVYQSIGVRVTYTIPSFVWSNDVCINFPIQYLIWIYAITEFHNSLRLQNIVEPLVLSTKLSLFQPYITSDIVLVLSRSDLKQDILQLDDRDEWYEHGRKLNLQQVLYTLPQPLQTSVHGR